MKRAAATAALEYVRPGMLLGVGTGSTTAFFIEALGELAPGVAAAVASSRDTERRLRAVGVPVVALDEAGPLPLYVDGADEVDPELRLIKGHGGAHTLEKMLATAAGLFVCIVDESKLVVRLGAAPLPLEVLASARCDAAERVAALGGVATERAGFVTDGGNLVLDVTGLDLSDPEDLEATLDAIPGVVECGLFARRRADVVLCGAAGEVRVLVDARRR